LKFLTVFKELFQVTTLFCTKTRIID